MAHIYFNELFSSKVEGNMAHILLRVEQKITEEMNHMLIEAYTKEKIFTTVKSMGPTKVASSDDFSIIFINNFGTLLDGM